MSFDLTQVIKDLTKTNVTKAIHHEPYDAISLARPELSQVGKTVLITGGGTNIGLAIAQAFVQASASTIIIVGRRAEVLEEAKAKLETNGTATKIIARTCDIVKKVEVDDLWKYLSEKSILVDVFVSNAAKFVEPTTMMDMGFNELWSLMEANLQAPMYFTEKFYKQAGNKPKYIVNVTTANIHATEHPMVAALPAYTLSKSAATLYFQMLAQGQPREKLQVVSYHPGIIYNDYWAALGADPKLFDDIRLTGAFAVWAASKEAAFFHGRFGWASWDIEELAIGELRERIDQDFYFLRGTIAGLKAGLLA